MKSRLPALVYTVLCLLAFNILSGALAQERHNSLAVDQELVDDAGPYYFIAYGNSTDAYAKATLLADAMGLEIGYSNETKTLTFNGNGITARMQATSDVDAGLVKRSGVLSANGKDIPSPMAIIVDGVSYVPIVPIAKAYRCDYAWHSQYRLITVDMPAEAEDTAAPEPAATNVAAAGGTAAGGTAAGGTAAGGTAASGAILEGFRVGVHDGFTRVALDLGSVQQYEIAVRDDVMLITFAANGTSGEAWEQRDDNIRSAYFTEVAGRPALVIHARHPLTADGSGFRVGTTDPNTLYVDFGPGLDGSAVAQLVTDVAVKPTTLAQAGQTVAVAPAPVPARPVVVLDAGHGGKFAGSYNGSWHEEDIVLNVTLFAKQLLEEAGVEVVLTRSTDTHLSTDYREDLSARAAFATPERNLFVSIHTNSVEQSSPHGIETYVFGQPLDHRLIEQAIAENGGGDRSLGRTLTNEAIEVANEQAGWILSETQLNYSRRLAHAVQSSLVESTGAADRGVKQGPFFVIRNARTPAILVELGFISNPIEGRKLASESYQRELARALVDGILAFLQTGGTMAVR
ncbi:MAG TPA: N-acetylmuramoyl-L-alanine amidase [Trueperaceae bacterium]